MSGDNEIRIYQLLKTVSDNTNNLSNIVNTLVETNAKSNDNLSTQMNNFKSEAHDKIDKIKDEVDKIRLEIRQTLDNIILHNMENDKRFEKQNDRIDQLETAFGEYAVKICEDDIRKKCSEWADKDNSKRIDKMLKKDKAHEETTKDIKTSFKKNLIQFFTNPATYLGGGGIVAIVSGIILLFKTLGII